MATPQLKLQQLQVQEKWELFFRYLVFLKSPFLSLSFIYLSGITSLANKLKSRLQKGCHSYVHFKTEHWWLRSAIWLHSRCCTIHVCLDYENYLNIYIRTIFQNIENTWKLLQTIQWSFSENSVTMQSILWNSLKSQKISI